MRHRHQCFLSTEHDALEGGQEPIPPQPVAGHSTGLWGTLSTQTVGGGIMEPSGATLLLCLLRSTASEMRLLQRGVPSDWVGVGVPRPWGEGRVVTGKASGTSS